MAPWTSENTPACEKVGVELVATIDRAHNALKAACLVPIGVRFEVKAATKGVFNSLTYQAKFAKHPF